METLEELRWMDAPSKEKAREKVTEMVTVLFHRFGVISPSFNTGHGDQRAHRIPGSHPAGQKPEA